MSKTNILMGITMSPINLGSFVIFNYLNCVYIKKGYYLCSVINNKNINSLKL